jgi:hypothetical protein
MSKIIIEDAGWKAIMADPQLASARRKMSFHEIRLIVDHARRNPPRHRYWGAGEPDCPRDIKAGNGELHTLRCKVCGNEDGRSEICMGATPSSNTQEIEP